MSEKEKIESTYKFISQQFENINEVSPELLKQLELNQKVYSQIDSDEYYYETFGSCDAFNNTPTK
jgi:hypothetical protein